jgi:hypothetical protein
MLKWLFVLVWKKWLIDDYTGKPKKVVKICSWRSALVDSIGGQRSRITVCFGPFH